MGHKWSSAITCATGQLKRKIFTFVQSHLTREREKSTLDSLVHWFWTPNLNSLPLSFGEKLTCEPLKSDTSKCRFFSGKRKMQCAFILKYKNPTAHSLSLFAVRTHLEPL